MDRLKVMRITTFAVPLLALVACSGAVAFEKHRLFDFRTQLGGTRSQIATAAKILKDMEGQTSLARFPTVAQTPQEQPGFLNEMRTYSDLNHVELIRWTTTTIYYAKNDPILKTMPPDVTQLVSNVVTAGTYADLRSFLYSLLRSPRLINLTDMKWARGVHGAREELSFTLTRYTTPPGKDYASISLAALATEPAPPAATARDRFTFKQGVLNGPDPKQAAAVEHIMPAVTHHDITVH